MPPKQKTVDIPFENPVEMTVYVINEDNRSIMMLENEEQIMAFAMWASTSYLIRTDNTK